MTRGTEQQGPPEGCVVGIETSWRLGSLALAIDGSVVARRFLTKPSAHAAGLIPALREVLDEVKAGVGDLAGVVVGAGPGSFTGVRIGAAAAKGLAASLRVPLYATSSLRAASFTVESLGAEAALPVPFAGTGPDTEASPPPLRGEEREVRYVVLDARQGRVYGACYDVRADGPVEVVQPHGGTILQVLNRRPPRDTVFVGDGAVAHSALIRAAGYTLCPYPAGVPVADAALLCCSWAAVDAAHWEPEYLRAWRPG